MVYLLELIYTYLNNSPSPPLGDSLPVLYMQYQYIYSSNFPFHNRQMLG